MAITKYVATKTTKAFHEEKDYFVRALRGPIGSGKSVACCWEIFFRICGQKVNSDGIRKSRWVIIRNTYRELVDTTKKTWLDWFPEDLGIFRVADMQHNLRFKLDDGTIVESEILFRALDKPKDIKKLLSLELTGGWINEAREIPKAILDALIGRIGRYPSRKMGGMNWDGVIMDTNPPDSDHWWYKTFEEECPSSWKQYSQPSAIMGQGENLNNLKENYYQRLMEGHDQEWINVYVHGKYGFLQEGKQIFPEYNDNLHCVNDLKLLGRTKVIYIGADFGLTPASVIAQQDESDGQIQILDEVVTEDMGAVRFADRNKEKIHRDFNSLPFEGWGDPAGDARAQTDEKTVFQILEGSGFPLRKTNTNDFTIRRESVALLLTKLTMKGRPSLVISPKCRNLRKALSGAYKYRKINSAGPEKYANAPDKNMYSHVAEALQYLCLGLGIGRQVIRNRNVERNYRKTAGVNEYAPI